MPKLAPLTWTVYHTIPPEERWSFLEKCTTNQRRALSAMLVYELLRVSLRGC